MEAIQRRLIEAHAEYLRSVRLQGWEIYYINITFAHCLVPPSERFSLMRMAVEEQMYPWLTKRLERHPERKSRHAILPRLFLWGDLPVFKHGSSRSRRVVNGGMHLNGFLTISPSHQIALQCAVWKKNRIENVFRENAKIYKRAWIHNIHLERVEDDARRVTDYAMKTLNSGRLDADAHIVLPRPWRPKPRPEPLDPSEKMIKDIQSELNVSRTVAEKIANARLNQSSKGRRKLGRGT